MKATEQVENARENFFKNLSVTNEMKAKLQADVEDQKKIAMEELPGFKDDSKRSTFWKRKMGVTFVFLLCAAFLVTLAVLTTIPGGLIAFACVGIFAVFYSIGLIEFGSKEEWKKGYADNIVEEVRNVELDIEKSVAKLTEKADALAEFNKEYGASLNDEQYYNFVYNSLNLHALAVEEIISNNRYKDLTKEQVQAIAEIAIDNFFKGMTDEQVKQLITDLAASNDKVIKSSTQEIFGQYERICHDINLATEELFDANKTKYLKSDIFQEVAKVVVPNEEIRQGELAEKAKKSYEEVASRGKKDMYIPNLLATESMYSSASRLDSVVKASDKVRKTHVEKVKAQAASTSEQVQGR